MCTPRRCYLRTCPPSRAFTAEPAAKALSTQHFDVDNAKGQASAHLPSFLCLPSLPVKVEARGLLWTLHWGSPSSAMICSGPPCWSPFSNCQALGAAGCLTGGTRQPEKPGIRWAKGKGRVTRWKSPKIGSSKPDLCRYADKTHVNLARIRKAIVSSQARHQIRHLRAVAGTSLQAAGRTAGGAPAAVCGSRARRKDLAALCSYVRTTPGVQELF